MNQTRKIEKYINRSLKKIHHDIKHIFGFNAIKNLEEEMTRIELVFAIHGRKPTEFPISEDKKLQSLLLVDWAKYTTLNHFYKIGTELILYKHLMLTKIKKDGLNGN